MTSWHLEYLIINQHILSGGNKIKVGERSKSSVRGGVCILDEVAAEGRTAFMRKLVENREAEDGTRVLVPSILLPLQLSTLFHAGPTYLGAGGSGDSSGPGHSPAMALARAQTYRTALGWQ